MVGRAILVTEAWRIAVWNWVAPSGDYFSIWQWTWNGFGRLSEFALGITAAYILVRHRQHIKPLMFLLLGILTFWLGYSYAYVRVGVFSPMSDLLIGGGFCLVLLSASGAGVAQKVFTFRPLVAAGAFSYSLYLIQEPVLVELLGWKPGLQGPMAFLVYTLGFGAITVLIGYLFYRVFERPSIAWGRRVARQQQKHTLSKMESPVLANASEQHAAP